MSDESSVKQIAAQVRTMRIFVFALCMGVVSFAGFVLYGGGPEQPAESNTLTLGAICFTVFGAAMGVIVPTLITAAQRKQIANGTWKPRNRQIPAPDSDVGRLLAVYQLSVIIRVSFFEGPGFLALIAYMSEGTPVSLGLAALSLIGLMSQFPTVGRVEQWVERQTQYIEEYKQFSQDEASFEK